MLGLLVIALAKRRDSTTRLVVLSCWIGHDSVGSEAERMGSAGSDTPNGISLRMSIKTFFQPSESREVAITDKSFAGLLLGCFNSPTDTRGV